MKNEERSESVESRDQKIMDYEQQIFDLEIRVRSLEKKEEEAPNPIAREGLEKSQKKIEGAWNDLRLRDFKGLASLIRAITALVKSIGGMLGG